MSLFSLQFRFDDLLAAQGDQEPSKQKVSITSEQEEQVPVDSSSSQVSLSSYSSNTIPSSPCKSPEPSTTSSVIEETGSELSQLQLKEEEEEEDDDNDAIERINHELTNKYFPTLLDISLKLPRLHDDKSVKGDNLTTDTYVTKLTRSEPHYSYRKLVSKRTTVTPDGLDIDYHNHNDHDRTTTRTRGETMLSLNRAFAAIFEPVFQKNGELVGEAVRIKQERAEAEARARARAEAIERAKAKAKAEAEARARREAEEEEEEERRKREEAEAEAKAKARAAAEARARAKATEEKEGKISQPKSEVTAAGGPSTTNKSPYITNFKAIEKTFWSYKEKIVSIKTEIVEPVKQLDRDQRNLLSRHKRKINPKFGQLTNSFQQLRLIASEAIELIQETKANPLFFKWILNFVAKAIVHQAETEVRVKPEAALPLARLSLLLMQKFPELEDFLMARLVKKCPYVIGFTCQIDTEAGRTNMGWKRAADNKWEDDASYNERIAGIATLYAVITRLGVSPVDRSSLGISEATNPWSIDRSWTMVARLANTPRDLLTDTHFVVLGAWWDAAAAQLLQVYGDQAAKLLQVVGDSLVGLVSDKRFVGAARLKILYEDFINSNNVKSFPEMDP